MPPDAPDREPRPDYRVYRSRPRLLDRLRPSGSTPLDALRRRKPAPSVRPPDGPRRGRPRLRRFLKWAAIAIGSWILLSLIVFLISAQTAPGVSDDAENALSGGGTLLTGSTILVLGSDQRTEGTKEPGATTSGPSRSDSILLLHVGFATVRKLSIPRDSYVPGLGKINSAYAQDGAAGAIRTVERFMGNGLQVNHVILVSFENFPKLIDALGGIDITLEHCLKSNRFGGKRIKLSAGDNHLTGREALRFARVRENRCAPNEDDRARAARQQQVNHVILVSFENFPKLIDALGGIDITLEHCLKSNRFGGKRIKLSAGDNHLTGREALRFARVRENRCAPNEDDRARAARQQQVLSAMRSKIVSPVHWPSTLVRLPLISWEAPRTLPSDMKGPGLMALFTDLLTGGSGDTHVLKPYSSGGPGNSLLVSEGERSRAVDQLLGK